MKSDRRRYPRATIGPDITVEAAGGHWQGPMTNLSPYGVKVSLGPQTMAPGPGARVQLRIPMGDHNSPLAMPATVVRADPNGLAFSFDILKADQFHRLKDLVDSLLLREWEELLEQIGHGQSAVAQAGPSITPTHPAPAGEDSPQAADVENAPEEIDRVGLRLPSRTPDQDLSQLERWQALLRGIGLEGLRLPSDGTLAQQWREFLRRLADNA